MSRFILAVAIALLAVSLPSALHAQEPAPLKLGDRVRLEWITGRVPDGEERILLDRPDRITGDIFRVQADGIVIADGDNRERTFTFETLQADGVTVSRSLGKKNRWLQSLGLGLLIGPGIAYAITEQTDPGWGALGALVFGVPAGVVGGLVVGSSLSRERWEPLGLNSIRATPVADIHGRLGVSVSLPVSW